MITICRLSSCNVSPNQSRIQIPVIRLNVLQQFRNFLHAFCISLLLQVIQARIQEFLMWYPVSSSNCQCPFQHLNSLLHLTKLQIPICQYLPGACIRHSPYRCLLSSRFGLFHEPSVAVSHEEPVQNPEVEKHVGSRLKLLVDLLCSLKIIQLRQTSNHAAILVGEFTRRFISVPNPINLIFIASLGVQSKKELHSKCPPMGRHHSFSFLQQSQPLFGQPDCHVPICCRGVQTPGHIGFRIFIYLTNQLLHPRNVRLSSIGSHEVVRRVLIVGDSVDSHLFESASAFSTHFSCV
ncbi:hypothetical protein LINPERHAP1_LOCUS37412 [Linum perenne]